MSRDSCHSYRLNTRNYLILLVILCYSINMLFDYCECRKQAPPLGAETVRKSNKAAECQLGKEVRELGSTWFADLGPPFGIMYCIICQCVPVQKKRRVIGKVHCRNIKHECPKPSCDEPVLHPGRCCKVCPSDLNSPDLIQDVAINQQLPEDEDKNYKYYASVMTGESAVATGRYSFHKRSLYFSFFSSSRPNGIQFLDSSGNILEEQDFSGGSVYQNATDKICGVWRRIPRQYRRLIREEKLIASLYWSDKTNVTGQIYRYRTLSTEMYTALLRGSEEMSGTRSGGTAIVSVSTTAPSIHVLAVVTGLFTKEHSNHAPLSIRLQTIDAKTIVFDEIVRIEKASPDLNQVEISAALSSAELRLLSRGKLRLSISSKDNEGIVRRLEGQIGPRAVCETFQALLTHQAEGDNSAGLAWLYIGREGNIHYHVRIERVARPVVIGLVTERRLLELEDLSPGLTSNGWTNGTLDAPAAKHLELLYSGELAVNVATKSSSSVIRGRLAPRFTASPVDSPAPLLLSNPETSISAIAWIDVDVECNLYYEVEISDVGSEYSLYLSQVPMEVPGAPVNRRFLETGGQSGRIEGSLLGLLAHELSSLQAGVIHLELQSANSDQPVLRARWNQVTIPESCLPHATDNQVNYRSDAGIVEINSGISPCYHGDRFHEDGSQWRSIQDHCTVCHCANGRVGCEPVVCAPIPSTCPVILPPSGKQCCPICSNVTSEELFPDDTKGCQMAGQFFAAGTLWHPYLPPNGFDTCTLCSCHAVTLKVSCPRVECPKLDCDERVSVRPDKRACCRVCPSSLVHPSPRTPSSVHSLREEEASEEEIAEEILATGGCKYPVGGPYRNGQEWHPRLYSHGELKCVKCRCKDGKVKCERKRCNRWSCNDECCAAQCKRRRRNIRRHH